MSGVAVVVTFFVFGAVAAAGAVYWPKGPDRLYVQLGYIYVIN